MAAGIKMTDVGKGRAEPGGRKVRREAEEERRKVSGSWEGRSPQDTANQAHLLIH